MNAELKNKCVLITGASGGIGLAVAGAFAEEGAKLVLHYHTNAEPVRELQRRIEVPNAAVQADLRDERQVERMYAESKKRKELVKNLRKILRLRK